MMFVATATPGAAQDRIAPDAAPRPTMRAARISGGITIDGKLDEAAWAQGEPITNFVQQFPETGAPARFRTVVRVLYDDDNIYVGAVNYDPEPAKSVIAGLEHDFVSTNSDLFGVVLDTYLDRRNSFLFGVNPGGAVRDEQTFNDSRNIVEAWEGISVVKTSFQDSSWTVELQIPLRTLRFDARKDPQAWGINFIRRVRRVNETSYWAPLDRQYRLHRMSRAGTMEGLSGLRQGRNLQVKPYVQTGRSEGAQVAPAASGMRLEGGGDLKYGVTPSMTLDLTYNTDFSQVEVDQQVVNLTRFGILFPERREFFIENAGSFTFGDVEERNYRLGATLSDFTLFNSRQIGLTPDGLPIPIVGGGRLTGRAGGWELGLLDMQTERTATTRAENFGVARVRRNVFGRSDVGVLYANRQAGGAAYNRSYGADANLRLFDNVVLNSYVAGSRTDSTHGGAGRVTLGFRNQFWNTAAMYKRVTAGFDPGIGFVKRRDLQQGFGALGVHARPRWPGIQEVNPYVTADILADPEGPLQTRTLRAGLDVSFRPDGALSLEVNDRFDRLDRPFVVVPGRSIAAGRYAYRDGGITFVSRQTRYLSLNSGVAGGEYYDGHRFTYHGGLLFRPRYDLSLEGTYQRNRLNLRSGAFAADVSGLRIRYARSTTLTSSTFVQYNTQARTFVTNARIAWRYAPLSDVFLVFTERDNTLLDVRRERSVVLKVTRMVSF